MLSVTDVVEHEFCSRFTYYTSVLGLSQYEENRGTVKSGRSMHKKHEDTNKNYVFGNLGGKKIVGTKFYSKKLELVGKIDEAIELDDEVILIERKYSNYNFIGDTIRIQIGLLALLIEENKNKPVRKAIVIFSKDTRNVVDFEVDEHIKEVAISALAKTKSVIQSGVMPEAKFDNRCLGCCFNRICPTGSLNMVE